MLKPRLPPSSHSFIPHTGRYERIYHAQLALSTFYGALDAPGDVIHYLSEALQAAARVEGSRDLEVQGAFLLGQALEVVENHVEASKCFERCRTLAVKAGHTDYEDMATTSLVKIKLELADTVGACHFAGAYKASHESVVFMTLTALPLPPWAPEQ